jgi:uncharacterized protein
MRFPLRRVALALPVLAAVLVVRCNLSTDNGSTPPSVDSTTTVFGNGSIQTFVTLDNAGHPTAVGVTFGEALLTGLPDSIRAVTLGFGPDAPATPFRHMYFDWVPHGHAPGLIYDKPHLDLHFYFASIPARLAVAGGVDSTPPAAAALPGSYSKVTESVAFMGTHYADTSGAEFHGTPFDKTLLYGSHDGTITFYDLMATKAWLDTKPANTVVPIAQPASYPKSGWYPTQFHVSYDGVTHQYRVALETFVQH